MSEERGKDSLSKMTVSEKQSVKSGSGVSSSASVKSNRSKDGGMPNFREETPPATESVKSGSHVSSSASVKSDWSKDGGMPNFSEKTPAAIERNHKNFKESLISTFQDIESKIIKFLKNELEMFKKILQKENTHHFVKDFNENRCFIKEAALDLTLHYLREMKQDEAANALEDELFFIHQLKCGLKKKYQCVFEGIAKHGDSTLLNNIYTDLYITQGGSEQINTEHEVRQIEVASRRHQSQEIPVECKKLFEAPEQDKKIRTVLTKGVAGIGKTISVQKFVLDWAEGKENQDIRFIFPLPFRELNLKEKEKSSLIDLITQFFPETKGLNLTRRNDFKVLFILDGLDECRLPLKFDCNETLCDISSPASLDVLLTNLMKGNLLPSALIWITTRPAAASKIPPDCIDRVTEVRGFNDAQKVEYFKKRFTDEKMAKEIIEHVKKSKSLFIMCHIPVFCCISATVLQNILEEKRNNDLENNKADEISKTLQESNIEDTPRTLTQMYTHFLRFQILQSHRKYKGGYRPDVYWDEDAILSLGKLAFHQLERNNLIFYESDLEACGIDVSKASVYSGMCTQIFKEETGITVGTMYCFVHLSIQEFIAALYAHLFLDIDKKSVFDQESTKQENKIETMIDLLKTAVDKALKSDNGHLDLFLRFLLGLSLQSNRQLLRGLLTQQDDNDQSKKEIVQYIKQKLEENLSPERSINLFYCLNELNDQTLVKEIQTHLSKGSLSSAGLSPAQWSALVFVLLTSEEELEEFELQKFLKSDECLIKLSAVIKTSKRALLNDCNLTDKSCSALATVLGSDTSLKELNMNNNNLQDSGVKLLCTGLRSVKCEVEILRFHHICITQEGCAALASAFNSNPSNLRELDLSENKIGDSGVTQIASLLENPQCALQTLRLSDCSITEEGYKALASALRSNPSHLRELDLTGNDPGQSGVKELLNVPQKPGRKLTLRFLSPDAEKACQYVNKVVGKNPLLLNELNLSEHELGDTNVEYLSALLKDKHCQFNTLTLFNCSITENQCFILTSALKSNPSHLRELNLSGNELENTGVKHLCDVLKDSHCKLERLRLSDCSITEEGYKALASALTSNPSHLRELDLTGNDPGQSGVEELLNVPQKPGRKLTLRFLSPDAEKACQYVNKVVGKNPLLLNELNLSEHELGDTNVEYLAALLKDKHCQFNTLTLFNCSITEEQCLILTSALKSNPSHLRELNLSGNELENTGVKHLCDVLKDSHCKLERLRLSDCSITEEGYKALASALTSNPSHLIELDLTGNDPGQSGVEELLNVPQKPGRKLTLRFLSPDADEACQYVNKVVGQNPLLLNELNLSEHELGDTNVEYLSAFLKDKHCQFNTLTLFNCSITEEQCFILTSALKSNPSHLRELNLSGNELENTGVKHLCDVLKDSHCKLERLRFRHICITQEGCAALASAFNSNPSNLRELDLSENKIGDSGVTQIASLLENPQCALQTLRLSDCSITEEGYKALASALRSNPSHRIELDLTGNDPGQSGVEELLNVPQKPGRKLTLKFLSPDAVKACQYVNKVVGQNPLFLNELNLSEHELGDTNVEYLSALLKDKHCQFNTLTLFYCSITENQCFILTSALKSNPSHLRELNLSGNELENTGVKHLCDVLKDSHCKLERLRFRHICITQEGCAALASAFNSNPSNLRELDLSENKIGDSGVTQIASLLENPQCALQILRLSDCSITEEGYKALASALRSNPSHLRELDLTGNDPGQSGVKELLNVPQKPGRKLTLRFLSPDADEACQYVNKVVGKNPLLLNELNLSEHELGDTNVEYLAALLKDKHCQFNTLTLFNCSITENQCFVLTSALKSNPSHLRELNLSGNELGDSGVKNLSDLLMNPQCKLGKLHLCGCSITENQCIILTSALKSNPSHLRDLNLSENKLGDSGVKNLSDLMKNPQCKLEKLHLCGCNITENQCFTLTSALKLNPSHLRQLDLSGNQIKNTGVKHLCDVLKDSHCKLERLSLRGCEMTDEGCSAVTSALKSNPSHLRELELSGNKLGDSGVKNLSDLLMQCKLEILDLCGCSITEEQSVILTSALKSNPSHLRVLDLSENELKNTGVKILCDILKDSHCKLESLSLNDCGITDVSSLAQSLTKTKALQFLKELDLSNNKIGESKEQLSKALKDSNCELRLYSGSCLKQAGGWFTSWF
ncbi:uncharacterized protein LOC125244424 isoform X2 [Megalobrama amblycephala]|uniref:uncharacterized protein LOC125244424 isoform X2 n=1 Tax=Megalobrama amblycephala TaxID=75352 RepID=UPI002013FC0B|nr:uncharacterized protein LOC125244424 isoform X2 [Megalobrama amblycephala]